MTTCCSTSLGRVVLAVLLEHLVAARRAGMSFEEAWPDAREAALRAVQGGQNRIEWASALSETGGAWQDAYERRPPQRSEWCLHALCGAPDLSVLGFDQPPQLGHRHAQRLGEPAHS